jgi:WD40 repeat protein
MREVSSEAQIDSGLATNNASLTSSSRIPADELIARKENDIFVLETHVLPGRNILTSGFDHSNQIIAIQKVAQTLKLWRATLRQNKLQASTFLVGHAIPVCAVISPDGSWFAVSFQNRDLLIWQTETLVKRNFDHQFGSWSRYLAFSEKGRFLAAASINELAVWDIESAEPIRRHRLSSDAKIHSLAISEDGRFLFAGLDRKLLRLDLSRDSTARVCSVTWGKTQPLVCTQNGDAAIYSDSNGVPIVWREHDQQIQVHSEGTAKTSCLAIQDSRFAMGFENGTLVISELESDGMQRILLENWVPRELKFSIKLKNSLLASDDGELRLLAVT